MAKYLKNKTGEAKTYQGRSFSAGVYTVIPDALLAEFANDLEVIADILADVCSVSSDGLADVGTKNDQINFLKSLSLNQRDADGAVISRGKATKTGWHYEPRSINFVTSIASSHYNRKHNGGAILAGTDYGDASLKFFDTNDVQLVKTESETNEEFQARLTSLCVKTCLDWQPAYEIEIIGGMLQVFQPPTTDAYMWAIIAPDIPEAYGGSVPFLAGGFNLKFFKNGSIEHYDGRSAKFISPDFVYNSNKFRIIVKHNAGVEIGIQVYFEHFRA